MTCECEHCYGHENKTRQATPPAVNLENVLTWVRHESNNGDLVRVLEAITHTIPKRWFGKTLNDCRDD